MSGCKGFTLIELMITIAIIIFLTSVMVASVNFGNQAATNVATQLKSDFAAIEMSFNRYSNDKNAYPTGLADASFVPVYLTPPVCPSGFDTTYATSGYVLTQVTGQPSPNNGYFICTRVNVSGPSDSKFQGIKIAAAQLPPLKFFYNTVAGATSNMVDPAAAATVYVTYWLMRN